MNQGLKKRLRKVTLNEYIHFQKMSKYIPQDSTESIVSIPSTSTSSYVNEPVLSPGPKSNPIGFQFCEGKYEKNSLEDTHSFTNESKVNFQEQNLQQNKGIILEIPTESFPSETGCFDASTNLHMDPEIMKDSSSASSCSQLQLTSGFEDKINNSHSTIYKDNYSHAKEISLRTKIVPKRIKKASHEIIESCGSDPESSDDSEPLLQQDFLSLKRSTLSQPSLSQFRPSTNHTILCNYNMIDGRAPLPFPKHFSDKWDSSHVRLPCSFKNLYPVQNSVTGEQDLEMRWDIVQRALTSRFLNSSIDLEEAILMYNTGYSQSWNFNSLHRFFTEVFVPGETKCFFESLLPEIVKLCLLLPKICTQPIPLLLSGRNHKITLSQIQIGSLLANAFFCTFPRRNSRKRDSEYSSFPDINFNNLFSSKGETKKFEKLKCLINYFRSFIKNEPAGVVTFHRQIVKEFPEWKNSQKKLPKMCVQTDGLIEVDGMGMLQIDFANKFVGGGVLKSGCVQEEIRFLICPELIVSRLFTERLNDNEVLIVTGCEQFNAYSGYAESFKWVGNFEDPTPRDLWGRRLTKVVAMDALHFTCSSEQYAPRLIQRELEKAYVGFLEPDTSNEFLSAVATGNWGCGAFRGDPRLKSLLQLISAAEAGRDILYFTYHDKQLEIDIKNMYTFLKYKEIQVGQLVHMLEAYYYQMGNSEENCSLYSFLFKLCAECTSETDID